MMSLIDEILGREWELKPHLAGLKADTWLCAQGSLLSMLKGLRVFSTVFSMCLVACKATPCPLLSLWPWV